MIDTTPTYFLIPVAWDANHSIVRREAALKHQDYVCPECLKTLHLRAGHKVRSHFYHVYPGDCTGESAIHYAAKSFLANQINYNRSAVSWQDSCPRCSHTLTTPLPADVVRADVECSTTTGFRVDVGLFNAADDLIAAIEIKNTHAVDEQKGDTLSIPWVEVDAQVVIDTFGYEMTALSHKDWLFKRCSCQYCHGQSIELDFIECPRHQVVNPTPVFGADQNFDIAYNVWGKLCNQCAFRDHHTKPSYADYYADQVMCAWTCDAEKLEVSTEWYEIGKNKVQSRIKEREREQEQARKQEDLRIRVLLELRNVTPKGQKVSPSVKAAIFSKPEYQSLKEEWDTQDFRGKRRIKALWKKAEQTAKREQRETERLKKQNERYGNELTFEEWKDTQRWEQLRNAEKRIDASGRRTGRTWIDTKEDL